MFRIVVAPGGLRSGASRLRSLAGKSSAIVGDVPASAPSGITPETACDSALNELFTNWQRVLKDMSENLETFADNLSDTAEMYSDTESKAKTALTPKRSRRG